MDINQPLDQAQIADAVNRQKVGTQRQRNEMMRLGTSDPNSFATQNESYIKQTQQAQQPSELSNTLYGNKTEAQLNTDFQNQIAKYDAEVTPSHARKYSWMPDYSNYQPVDPMNWDTMTMDYAAQSKNDAAQHYKDFYTKYSSPTQNTSGLQEGTAGYTQQDLGRGRYGLFDSMGAGVGLGYKDVTTAVDEILASNRNSRHPGLSGLFSSAPRFSWDIQNGGIGTWDAQQRTQNEALNKLSYYGVPVGNSDLNAALRQAELQHADAVKMNDSVQAFRDNVQNVAPLWGVPEDWGKKTERPNYAPGTASDWEMLGQAVLGRKTYTESSNGLAPTNYKDEPIRGENTLFGSTPMFYNGKQVGYKTNLNLEGPTHASVGGKYNHTDTYLGRDFSNSDGYSNLTRNMSGGNVFVPMQNAYDLPGWINTEKTTSTQSDTPAEKLVKLAATSLFNYFLPGSGSMFTAMDSYGQGDTKGAGLSLLGGALSGIGNYANVSGLGGAPVEVLGDSSGTLSSSAGGVFGSGIDLGSTAYNQAAQGALLSGIGNMAGSSGNNQQRLLSGLTGGLGSIAGAGVGSATKDLGQGLSGLLSGATKGAVGSLGGSSNSILKSAMSSGLGSGLGGLFNQVSDVTDKKKQSQNIQATQQAVKLAQLFRNNNGARKTNSR